MDRNLKKKILVTDPIHPEAVLRLTQAGFEVTELPEERKSNLKQEARNHDAIICRTSTQIGSDLFETAPNISCIAIASTGYDRIDIEAAKKYGISVLGLPSHNANIDPEKDGNFVSTAEHAVLLILAALGDLYSATSSLKAGRWEKKYLVGNELAHKTVGLLGFGRIAGLVAKRLAGFNTKIIAFDTYVSKEKASEQGVELVSLEELCRESDIISIHLPKTKETTGIIGPDEFLLMKDGVFIVNTARAAIVDENALIDALKKKKVRRAALDVFHDEPDGINHELIELENVIATPHIGGSTHEAWLRISLNAAENIVSFFNGDIRNKLNP